MSTDDIRRPFYKRPPMITKTPAPRPYTTLNQPAGERLSRQSADVSLKPLGDDAIKVSDLSARLVNEGLSDLANQINSSEYQARLAQRAAELAHASETSSQLKKALEDLRSKEISGLDAQITTELERQGITKDELQRNPRLRASVTKWKRDIYAGVNKGLSSSEASAIEETQRLVFESQKEGRASLAKDIAGWRAEIAPDVEAAISGSRLQKTADSLVKRGVITVDNDQMSVHKSVADLTDSEVKELNSLGFTVSESDVSTAKEYNKQLQTIDNLVSQGLITKNNDVLSLNKPLAGLSSGEVDQLNKLGFTISDRDVEEAKMYAMGSQIPTLPKLSQQQVYTATGTTKFTAEQIASQNLKFKEALDSGKITAEQYNQAVSQQNANLNAVTAEHKANVDSLISSGTLKKTVTGRAGGLQSAYAITKPLASISDSDISKLEKVGFTITPEMRTQRVETQNLIKDKVVRIENNQLKLLKPVSALSDSDISHLKNVGFSVPDTPKGPSAYLYEAAKSQGYQPGTALKPDPFGAARSENLRNLSAVVGDVFQTVTLPLLPYQLAMSLVPGEQPLESGFRGPTSSSLSYYEDVSPSRQVGLTALGALASYSTGALASVPIGFAAKVVPSVAKQFTVNIGKTMSNTALATSIKSIASNLKLSGNAVIKALPVESASAAQLGKAMTVLMKNPKFQQAVLWSTMAGMNAADVYSQLARGESVDKVIERSAVSLAGQLGSFKGFTAGYKIGDQYVNKMATLVRLTGGEVKLTPKGEVETPFTQSKQVPKAVKDLFELEFDQATGKINVVGLITKSGGKRSSIPIGDVFTQPIVRQYDATSFNRLMQSGKVGLTDAELNKLSVKQLFDKVVSNKNLSATDVKTILVKYIGDSGYKQLELAALKGGGKELLSMSPKEMKTAVYKELGEGSQWSTALKELEKGQKIRVEGKYEYLAAFAEDAKVKVNPDVQKVFNQLKTMGFDDVEASYWTSQILTKNPEQIAGKMENLIDNALDKQKLTVLLQSDVVKSSTSSQILKASGLNDAQVENVIKATAMSKGDQKAFVQTLNNLDSKSAGATLQLLSKDQLTQSLSGMKPVSLSKVVDSAVSSGNVAFVSSMFSVMSAGAAGQVFNSLPSSSLTTVTPMLDASTIQDLMPELDSKPLVNLVSSMSTKQLNDVLPELSPKTFSALTPKLDASALTRIIPNLSADQLNFVLPSLSQESLNEVLTELTPEQIQTIFQKLDLSPQTILTPQAPISGVPTPIPPVIIKRLADTLSRQNKQDMAQQKTRTFDVTLQYPLSSAHFKVKSNSFHGASREALLRRGTNQIPVNVVVKPLREQ